MWRFTNSATLRLNFTIVRHFALKSAKPKAEPKFTQSAAFQGRGSPNLRNLPNLRPGGSHFSSDTHDYLKVLSPIGSLLVLAIYFGWLREPSDLDEIWNTPPHILTSNLERRMLREQIKDAEAKKMDTTLLQAQLDYVDVKEAALKIQFDKKVRLEEKRKQRKEAAE